MKRTYSFVFTEKSLRQFQELASDLKGRIKEKLKHWQEVENPLQFAKRLTELKNATHRFRIGKYRILCKVENKDIVIVKLGPRDTVYKKT